MKLAQISNRSLIGLFTVMSGAFRITDPCYDMHTWCAGTLGPVRNGGWKAQVGYHMDLDDMRWTDQYISKLEEEMKGLDKQSGAYWICEDDLKRLKQRKAEYTGRVAYIHVFHESVSPRDMTAELDSTWVKAGIHVGVDSGQAGFFDFAQYEKTYRDKKTQEAFYDGICNLTLGKDQFGVNEFGAVSSSGYGDGGYEIHFRSGEDGKVEEAVIIFIEEYEEEGEGEEVNEE